MIEDRKKLELYINETFRSLPFTSMFFILIGSILYNYKKGYIIFIILFIDNYINKILKYIFKNYIHINGERPKDAKNCGCFIDLENINKKSITYGMPSGHSENIFLLSTLLQKQTNNNYIKILLYLIACYGGYMRVKLGCHTINQVIIGSLIGVIIGLLCNKYII
jgi:membrane-associated phospholipid phosphatase